MRKPKSCKRVQMKDVCSVLERYPEYEAVIGMEVHVQLTTESKIFCSSANHISTDPNVNICIVCAGYPGVLPTLNRRVIDFAIAAGLATNCDIALLSKFDRKHYFYPDLPKGYQITQQFEPICRNGHIVIQAEDGSKKKIRINRIHIEEDAGKNIHSDLSQASFVNLNRAGTPLLEIVSEPDLSTAHDTKAYLKSLRAIVQYLGICSGNMEEGAFRADTNISVRKKGDPKLGTKCEMKNINSFKFIADAVDYEIERQINVLEDGGIIKQETRLWDSVRNRTVVMRTKEGATDYRFFEDPDLPLVQLDEQWIATIKNNMPELPHEKFERFCGLGLSAYEATILVDDAALADYFDKAWLLCKSKSLINWVLRDVMGYLKDNKTTITDFNVTPQKLAQIVTMVEDSIINNGAAKEVFTIVAQNGAEPLSIVEEKGLKQIGSVDELEELVRNMIVQNPQQVADYKSGKNDRLFGFFVGKVMQLTKGKGNPTIINELLKKHLS